MRRHTWNRDTRFNGAARSHARRCGHGGQPVALLRGASMGPRVRTRGDEAAESIGRRWVGYEMLQWGRAFARAEISGAGPRALPDGRASMGPRVRTRGDREIHETFAYSLNASMGPRVRTRGDPYPAARSRLKRLASMGPRVRTRGDQNSHVVFGQTSECFNGAARSHARRCNDLRLDRRIPMGFNGAARSHARRCYARDVAARRESSFNGAARSHARRSRLLILYLS